MTLSQHNRRATGWRFMTLRDIGLFLKSAKTDSAITRWRTDSGSRAAFEAAYETYGDPWAAADGRYRYQQWKYEHLLEYLPSGRRFTRALDVGCGLGMLTKRLAGSAHEVIGLDIAQAAVDKASAAAAGIGNIRYMQGDALSLPDTLGRFDLIVIADTLYYLPPPITPAMLKKVAVQISKLLAPGGLCLLANHYFFSWDRDSRLSRRIHNAFAWSPHFEELATSRRPFYLVSILGQSM